MKNNYTSKFIWIIRMAFFLFLSFSFNSCNKLEGEEWSVEKFILQLKSELSEAESKLGEIREMKANLESYPLSSFEKDWDSISTIDPSYRDKFTGGTIEYLTYSHDNTNEKKTYNITTKNNLKSTFYELYKKTLNSAEKAYTAWDLLFKEKKYKPKGKAPVFIDENNAGEAEKVIKEDFLGFISQFKEYESFQKALLTKEYKSPFERFLQKKGKVIGRATSDKFKPTFEHLKEFMTGMDIEKYIKEVEATFDLYMESLKDGKSRENIFDNKMYNLITEKGETFRFYLNPNSEKPIHINNTEGLKNALRFLETESFKKLDLALKLWENKGYIGTIFLSENHYYDKFFNANERSKNIMKKASKYIGDSTGD